MNTKKFKFALVVFLLLGMAFLQTAYAQTVDHSMHGVEAPAADSAPAAFAASEGDGMGSDGMISGGHGKHHHNAQNIVVKLDHFDAMNWEDPFPGGHNWQPVCMAFGIANRALGENHENHVTLFLNLQGVELADTAAASDLSGFTCLNGNLQESWDNLVNNGVEIAVCPGCAIVGDVTPDTLREGAFIATGDDVSRIFLEADKVIDY